MKMAIKIGISLLILFSGIYLIVAIYIIKNAEKDEKKQADVILILGTSNYRNKKYDPCLVARVKHGVDLYKAGYAPKLLFSGGINRKSGVIEAHTMKEIALSFDVPAKDILLESVSTSTYENFLLSEKLLKANQLKSVIVVTEPFHLPRAVLVAQKQRLNVVGSPALGSACWTEHKYRSYYFLREPLAIIYYKINNRL